MPRASLAQGTLGTWLCLGEPWPTVRWTTVFPLHHAEMPTPVGTFQNHAIRLLPYQSGQSTLHSGTCYHIPSLLANWAGSGLRQKDSWTVAIFRGVWNPGRCPSGSSRQSVSREHKGPTHGAKNCSAFQAPLILTKAGDLLLISVNILFRSSTIH